MGKKIPVVLAKVHGRAAKRPGFDGFFRAGVKWTDDPKGADHDFVVVEYATEKALNNDEREALGKLLAAGKVVRESHFQGLLSDALMFAVVKSAKASECELPDSNTVESAPARTLLERLSEVVVEEPAPKQSTKR